jgi:hypothetical protein
MATSGAEPERWLRIGVCLRTSKIKKKNAGILDAKKVNIIHMPIKVDTGCRELALPKTLVEQHKLVYADTVQVSSSTDSNVPIERYGPAIIYWDGHVFEATAYCMPSLDSALLGFRPLLTMKPDFDSHKTSLKSSILSSTSDILTLFLSFLLCLSFLLFFSFFHFCCFSVTFALDFVLYCVVNIVYYAIYIFGLA